MIRILLFSLFLVGWAYAAQQQPIIQPIEMVQLEETTFPAYIPDSLPFDNPVTNLNDVPTLPSYPNCQIRPSTVHEIKRMRSDAANIAFLIEHEVHVMQRRKMWVEHMTNYLNERILELNKVKGELRAEAKWMDVMQKRIIELQTKEKLIKLNDITDCLNLEKSKSAEEDKHKSTAISSLSTQSSELQTKIIQIQKEIKDINAQTTGGGAAVTPGSITPPATPATPAASGAAPTPTPPAPKAATS